MKETKIRLESGSLFSSGVLLEPANPRSFGVILGHGAGGNMNAPFMNFFHRGIADAGYPCLKFNFFYSEARKKAPDPQHLLISCFEKAIEAMPVDKVLIGGKSMGGRIASYVAAHQKVAGLIFLGYPLHPPGKMDQLRDQHLYSIGKPMLFASGTKDPFARLDLLNQTIEKIGIHATRFLVENGGHSFEVPKKNSRPQAEILNDVLHEILRFTEGI